MFQFDQNEIGLADQIDRCYIPRPSLSLGRYLAAGWLETRRVRSTTEDRVA